MLKSDLSISIESIINSIINSINKSGLSTNLGGETNVKNSLINAYFHGVEIATQFAECCMIVMKSEEDGFINMTELTKFKVDAEAFKANAKAFKADALDKILNYYLEQNDFTVHNNTFTDSNCDQVEEDFSEKYGNFFTTMHFSTFSNVEQTFYNVLEIQFNRTLELLKANMLNDVFDKMEDCVFSYLKNRNIPIDPITAGVSIAVKQSYSIIEDKFYTIKEQFGKLLLDTVKQGFVDVCENSIISEVTEDEEYEGSPKSKHKLEWQVNSKDLMVELKKYHSKTNIRKSPLYLLPNIENLFPYQKPSLD